MSAVLQQQVNRFCAWHRLQRWLGRVQVIGCSALAVLALLILLDKLLFFQLEAAFLAQVLGYLALLAALVAWLTLPRQPGTVAYLVDRELGLKNLLGSALDGQSRDDELARLLVARAEKAVNRVPARRPMPLRVNRWGRWLALPLAVLLLALWLPPRDWLGRRAAWQRQQAEAQQVQQATFVLQEKVNEVNQVLKRFESVAGKQVTQDLKALEQDLQGAGKAEALVKMGELADKYRDDFEQAKQFGEAARTLTEPLDLGSLDSAQRDLLQGLQDSLKSGDMAKAAEALREVAKRLQDPTLSPEQREALAKQAGKLAEQLKDAAQQTQQASQQSQGKGQTGPQQANQDGQQAQQQPGQEGQPNPSQQQQQAQSAQQAAQAAQQMAEALQKMPGGQMNQQSAQQMAEAAEQLADAMDQFAAMDQMRQGLESARQEMVGEGFESFDPQSLEAMMQQEAESYASLGEGQPGQGEGEGEGQGQGQQGQGQGKGGTGGAGQGKGGVPPEAPTDTAFADKKSESRLGEGAILNQIFVQGLPEKGEFPEAYTSAALAARQDAAGALARNRVPREYENMVKGYFDSLTPPAPETAP